VVWLDFNPQRGREQAGRLSALVLSAEEYNKKVGLMIACPITSKVKGYPFEVKLPANLPVSGVALSDQVRSIDWKAREAAFACKTPDEVTCEVLAKLVTLLE
jgi:mRNA interferase MazF